MQALVLVILELLHCLLASQGMAVMQWLRLHVKKYIFSSVADWNLITNISLHCHQSYESMALVREIGQLLQK